MQPLKLATSYLVHNLGLREITFSTKISGGLDRGASKKRVGPLFISASIEGGNFKFGKQLGIGV